MILQEVHLACRGQHGNRNAWLRVLFRGVLIIALAWSLFLVAGVSPDIPLRLGELRRMAQDSAPDVKLAHCRIVTVE